MKGELKIALITIFLIALGFISGLVIAQGLGEENKSSLSEFADDKSKRFDVVQNDENLEIFTDSTNLIITVEGCIAAACSNVNSKFPRFDVVLNKINDDLYKFSYDLDIGGTTPNLPIELKVSIEGASPVNGIFRIEDVIVDFNDIENSTSFVLEDNVGFLSIKGTLSGGDTILLDPTIQFVSTAWGGFFPWERDLVRSPDNTLWAIVPNITAAGFSNRNMSLFNSTDNGTTWNFVDSFIAALSNPQVLPNLLYDTTEDYLHILYSRQLIGTDNWHYRSYNITSSTLGAEVVVDTGFEGRNRYAAQNSTGGLFYFIGVPSSVTRVKISTDDGATWMTETTHPTESLTFVQGVVDDRDVIHLFYNNETTPHPSAYINYSNGAFSDTIVVPAPQIREFYPTSAYYDESTNTFHAGVYCRGLVSDTFGICYVKRNATGLFNPVRTLVNVSGQQLFYPQIINTTDEIFIFYVNDTSDSIHYLRSNDTGETFSSPVTLCEDCRRLNVAGRNGFPKFTSGATDGSKIEILFQNFTVNASYLIFDTVIPPIDITILSPENASILNHSVVFNFSISGNEPSYTCFREIDQEGEVLVGDILDGSSFQEIFTNLSIGFHNITARCNDTIGGIGLNSVFFSLLHFNITLEEFNSEDFETNSSRFFISIDVAENVDTIGATFNYSGALFNVTALDFIDNVHFNFTRFHTLPIISSNGTVESFFWNFSVNYDNGTVDFFNDTSDSQTLKTAYHTRGLNRNNTVILEGQNILLNETIDTLFPLINADRTITISTNITINNTEAVATQLSNTSTEVIFNRTILSFPIAVNTTFFYNATWIVSDINNNSRTIFDGQYSLDIVSINVTTDCSLPNTFRALNFTFFDEEDPETNTVNNSLQINMIIYDTSGSFTVNKSFDLNETTGFSICISPISATLVTNSTIDYTAEEFRDRNFFLIEQALSLNTTIQQLFNINETIEGQVRILVESKIKEPLPDAFVKIQRRYLEEGELGEEFLFRTVAMIKTVDVTGDGFTYVRHSDAFYRFVVQDGTTILKIFDERQIQKSSITDLFATITLRLSADPAEVFRFLSGDLVSHTCTDSNITSIVTCTINDISGEVATANLTVYKAVSRTWIQVCQNITSVPTIVTINCDVSSQGNGTFWWTLRITTESGNVFSLEDPVFSVNAGLFLGTTGLLIIAMLYFTSFMAGLWRWSVGLVMSIGSMALGFLIVAPEPIFITGIMSMILLVGLFILKGR